MYPIVLRKDDGNGSEDSHEMMAPSPREGIFSLIVVDCILDNHSFSGGCPDRFELEEVSLTIHVSVWSIMGIFRGCEND